MRRTNPDFLNGVPELLILQLLERRPMHGYDLVQSIRTSSGERIEFGEGCIYPLLHRLEAQGLLASKKELADGRRRIVYRVTPAGRKKLEATVSTWREVVAGVNIILQGSEHGRPALA